MNTDKFLKGFEKRARLLENANANAVADGAIGLHPFGTTVSSLLSDRPEGHSRGSEWLGRTAGSLAGGLAGGLAGYRLNSNSGLNSIPLTAASLQAAIMLGSFLGEAGASRLLNKKYYENGRLKPEYKKGKQKLPPPVPLKQPKQEYAKKTQEGK
ncbi:MAG: hypothetical protein EBZ49_00485 [Proteobacteria bacterium]|nr:hypothetical protein [Pseudomonadota bacterium]